MDQKISTLPAAASAVGTDQHEVNQGGVSRRLTNAQIATYIETALTNLTIPGTLGIGAALVVDGVTTETFVKGPLIGDAGGWLINPDGFANFAGTLIQFNANGSASFAGGQVQFSATGDVTFTNGGLDVQSGAVAASAGFAFGANSGVTQNITVLTALPSTFATLHFEGGILTSVT